MTADPPPRRSALPTLRETAAVLVLLGSVAGVGMAFAWPWVPRSGAAGGAALARYVPVADGWAALYARSAADGSPRSWESQNQQVLLPGRALAGELRRAERGAVESFFLRRGETRLDDAELLRRLEGTLLVRTVTRELAAADGGVKAGVALSLRDGRGDWLLSLYDPAADRDMVFDPAVLNVPAGLAPGRAWEGKGKLMGTTDYAFTGRVAEAGPFPGRAGELRDCLRLETRFVLASGGATLGDDRWSGWYCAGVGLVDEETRDASGRPTQHRAAATAVSLPPAPPAAAAAPAAGGAWSLTRLARLGQLVHASEGTALPVWIPGERPLLLAAGQGSDLTAYDAADPTGTVLWRFHPGGTVYSPPGHDPRTGRLFFGASDKRLYALDRRGLFLWSFATGDNVATRPLPVGDLVVFGSEDRRVYAVEAATGKLRWTRTTGGAVVSSPAAVGTVVAVGSDDGTVYGLDARTGRELWAHPTDDAVEAPVAAAGGTFYVASRDQMLRALDPRTGRARWTARVGSPVRAAPAVGPGAVYAVDHYGHVKAFDRATGRRLWTTPDGYAGPAAVAEGGVYVPRADGGVHRLDPRTGRVAERWSVPAAPDGRTAGFRLGVASGGGALWLADDGAGVWRLGPPTGGARPLPLAWSRAVSDAPFELSLLTGTPVRWGARTLLLDRGNALYEVDPATGRAARLGKVAGERSAVAEPAVAGDVLLVPAGNTLYAALLPAGRPLWSFRGDGVALAPPAAAGGTALWTAQRGGGRAGDESGTLYAVDLATGRLRWSRPVRGVGAVGGAVARGGTVFLGTPATALELATGRVLWTARPAGSPVGTPALSGRGDVLYAGAVDADGRSGSVAALDAATGRVRWRAPLRDEVPAFLERLWTSDGLVVVPTLDGRVVALDAATGAERWRHAPDAPRLGGITVQDGRVYLALQNGQVVALDAATGRPAARFADLELNLSAHSLAQRPAVAGGRVIVPTGPALLGFQVPR